MKKLIALFITFSFFRLFIFSAPLNNIPLKLTQPDGSEIACFTSGDEFYHWLHDSLGNTIFQDSISKYYCYQVENSDSLIFIKTGIIPSVRLSKNIRNVKEREKIVRLYNSTEIKPYHFPRGSSRSATTINNIVIYITFSDQSDYTENVVDSINSMLNNSNFNANSLKQYYWASSYNQLIVDSYIYPSGNNTFSYHDIYPRDYYCPYSNSNPIGYTFWKGREDSLLVRAITAVQNQIPSNLNLDTDNDGCVDNLCFIIKGGTTAWNTLLWPHKWNMLMNKYINGKKVYNYNLQLSDYILSHKVGVLCHEFGHTLGLPDLYHGYPDTTTNVTWTPVGRWDIMASNGIYPQQTSCYMKCKYLHWIDSIPEISRSGRYSLYPITSSPQGYKIPIRGSSEFLYLEYRNNMHQYDQSIPRSGLLIYRINSVIRGNFGATKCGGVNDEVYVYRPNGTLTSDGILNSAPFCVELDATEFNETTNPQQFLSNGNLGNIYISHVTACDTIIGFDVKVCSPDDIVYNQDDIIPPYTNANFISTSGNITVNSNTTFEAVEGVILNSGFEVLEGTNFEIDIKPCE